MNHSFTLWAACIPDHVQDTLQFGDPSGKLWCNLTTPVQRMLQGTTKLWLPQGSIAPLIFLHCVLAICLKEQVGYTGLKKGQHKRNHRMWAMRCLRTHLVCVRTYSDLDTRVRKHRYSTNILVDKKATKCESTCGGHTGCRLHVFAVTVV